MQLPISEIFYSLQGEGRNSGKPSIFVRFRGCNLQCKWCDSRYAWAKEFMNERRMYELEELVNEIKIFDCKHVIFTGGEPLLYEEGIGELMDKLGEGYTYEIETNGSIKPTLRYSQVNVSYKLSNSGNKEYELRAIGDYDYKFVCSNEDDIREVNTIINKYNIKHDCVFIMPLGTTVESQMNKELIDLCLKEGYRFCQRMHLILFGNKKGV